MRTLLSAVEESLVVLVTLINLDELSTSEELHDEARGHDGANAELHQSAAVRCENDTHPVEGIRGLRGLDAVEGNLRADKENEQRERRPDDLVTESDLQDDQLVSRNGVTGRTFLPPSGCATSGMIAMKGFTR